MNQVLRFRMTVVIVLAAATLLFEIARVHADERGNQLVTCVRVIENNERVSAEQAGEYCGDLKRWALEAIVAGRIEEVDVRMRGLLREKKGEKLSMPR